MLDLGWISFNSWLYLVGALSALIPLLIHLSRSRRTKKMRFSTTRFFTEQFLRSYRMSKLREVLLLACRMALFALLALALTGTFFTPKSGAVRTSGGSCLSASTPRPCCCSISIESCDRLTRRQIEDPKLIIMAHCLAARLAAESISV